MADEVVDPSEYTRVPQQSPMTVGKAPMPPVQAIMRALFGYSPSEPMQTRDEGSGVIYQNPGNNFLTHGIGHLDQELFGHPYETIPGTGSLGMARGRFIQNLPREVIDTIRELTLRGMSIRDVMRHTGQGFQTIRRIRNMTNEEIQNLQPTRGAAGVGRQSGDQIESMFNQGMRPEDIGAQFGGMSRRDIYRSLENRGLRLQQSRRPNINNETIDDMLQSHRNGAEIDDIARVNGLTREDVGRLFRRRGYYVRDRGPNKKKSDSNTETKSPVTPENLTALADRFGLDPSSTRTSSTGESTYYRFLDRQPLLRRLYSGDAQRPMYEFRFSNHPADRFDINRTPMTSRNERGFDVSPGTPLGNINTLEQHLYDRFRSSIMPRSPAEGPRQHHVDPNQLSFMRALMGEE